MILGTLRDGTVFDEGTTTLAPYQVVKGWTEVLQLMAEVRSFVTNYNYISPLYNNAFAYT